MKNKSDAFVYENYTFLIVFNLLKIISSLIEINCRNNQYRIIHAMKDHSPFHAVIQSDIAQHQSRHKLCTDHKRNPIKISTIIKIAKVTHMNQGK
jgi:hypothetical protein